MKATEYPCKEIPGNTWYQFKAHGHVVGYSGPPALELRLLDEVADGFRTLRIVNRDGSPVLDDQGRITGVTAGVAVMGD